MKKGSALLLCALAAACGDSPAVSEERRAANAIAARQACAAEVLDARARDELQTLRAAMAQIPGAVGFQEAYAQHAQLRHAAFAQLDSALNHSPTPADSVRHIQAAEGFRIRAPTAESVEENVIRSYETNFAMIFTDPDHPCNLRVELEQ